MIGVFDSGYGGLTVLNELIKKAKEMTLKGSDSNSPVRSAGIK